MAENKAIAGRDRLDTAAALICGETLIKFSGKSVKLEPISMSVLNDTKRFPSYTVSFLNMGWVLPSDEVLHRCTCLHFVGFRVCNCKP